MELLSEPAAIATIATLVLCASAFLLWKPIRTAIRHSKLDEVKRDFHRQRERLEARFVQIASASGRPRGLAWNDVDFADEVVYAWDRATRRLTGLVAVTVSFQAVEGGGMEDVEAVGNLRAATAVFHHDGRRWQTEGKTVFNLNPAETVRHYGRNLQLVAQDGPRR